MKRLAWVLMVMLLFAVPVAAQTFTVTVLWDANKETDLAGYQVFYGTASGDYTNVVDTGLATQVTITLESGSVYYFAVKAYNTKKQFSPFSIEVNTASGNSLRPPGTPVVRK